MAESSMSSAAIVGCTGLVGSHILSTLVFLPSSPTIHAIARRPLPKRSSGAPAIEHISTDNSTWPSTLAGISPTPQVLFSALGTSRAAAGGLDKQRQIDYDLNLAMAEAAHKAGVPIYVLISSAGSSPGSIFPYSKMKGELEEAVKKIGFKHAVIVRPGLLVGDREAARPLEGALRSLAKGMGSISPKLKDFWAQDADAVARAAVKAGMECVEGKRKEGVWLVEQADILALVRAEEKEGK